MAKRILSYTALPLTTGDDLATTPNPGISGSFAWNSSVSKLMFWNGGLWDHVILGTELTSLSVTYNTLLGQKLNNNGPSFIGNMTASATGQRFLADFTTTPHSSRLLFQTTTANGNSIVGVIPNGTATTAGFNAYTSSTDPSNSSFAQMACYSTDVRFSAGQSGTGGYLPMTFYTGGAEAYRVDTSRNMGIGTATPKARLDVTNTAIGGGAPLTTGSSADPNQSARFGAGATALDFGAYLSGVQWIQGRAVANYATNYGLALNPNGGEVRVGTSNSSGYTFSVATGDASKFFGVSTDANTAYAYSNGNMAVGSTAVSNLWLVTNNTVRMVIDGTGAIASTGGAIGYTTGAGGTVTQITSRTTGVTFATPKPSMAVTLYSIAGSTTWQSFTVTNSLVSTYDSVVASQLSGVDIYEIHISNVTVGSFKVSFRTTGGTTVEAPVFKFTLVKGSHV